MKVGDFVRTKYSDAPRELHGVVGTVRSTHALQPLVEVDYPDGTTRTFMRSDVAVVALQWVVVED